MLTNKQILQVALQQSAIDSGCAPEDFLAPQGKVVLSRPHPDARRYLKLPFACDLTSYGHCVVASVAPELTEAVEAYILKFPPEHCFETPNLHVLMQALRPHGYDVCFMAEYWLPDVEVLAAQPSPYPTRLLFPEDFAALYVPAFSNALCAGRQQLDRIAVGAYDGDRLIALAGASADCDTMWQIGIDVLPEYRRKGIASALASRLAMEILQRDIVPFYCCAWSNIGSARTAVRSGFRPAWVQVTAKPIAAIEEMNR